MILIFCGYGQESLILIFYHTKIHLSTTAELFILNIFHYYNIYTLNFPRQQEKNKCSLIELDVRHQMTNPYFNGKCFLILSFTIFGGDLTFKMESTLFYSVRTSYHFISVFAANHIQSHKISAKVV